MNHRPYISAVHKDHEPLGNIVAGLVIFGVVVFGLWYQSGDLAIVILNIRLGLEVVEE
jgi:hypothetical protein